MLQYSRELRTIATKRNTSVLLLKNLKQRRIKFALFPASEAILFTCSVNVKPRSRMIPRSRVHEVSDIDLSLIVSGSEPFDLFPILSSSTLVQLK